jgi:uncharacterized protein YecE (DUF72 family)
MRARGRARIGCSGWQYRHWRGDLYAAELPQSRWFAHYASIFHTVEINNTFYRLPEESTFVRWRENAPPGFIYAVKASRFLTHLKRLKDPEEPVQRFFDRARALGSHLGPVLYQLPPGWKLDLPRLEHFLQVVPTDVPQVLEFRDTSWYADEVLALLEKRHIALCLHDMRGSASPRIRTAPFVYVRYHGPGGTYSGGYSRERLMAWAGWLSEQQAGGADIYAYFNNDVGGHAPRDALTLERLMEGLA